eukprot:XP_015577601.1 uncharacterized protein LOC8275239 isoform X1 [Ricinus communis]
MEEAARNPIITVVLEVGMHCEGCASEIVHSARGLKGVERVKVNIDSNELIVVGQVDPLQIQEDLSRKIKKKVELVSPQPKNGETITTLTDKNGKQSNEERLCIDKASSHPKNEDTTTGNKDYDKKSNDKNPDIIHDKPKEAVVTTTLVLKLGHYCQGCSSKIRKTVSNTKGVLDMAVDEANEIVTIKGSMDAKLLVNIVSQRLNMPLNIVSLTEEEYSTSNGEDSEKVSDHEKKGSEQENGSDDTEMKGSIMELEPQTASATMAVFKVPLHCDGCTKKIRKIISRIRGVLEVRINREEETVTVISTIDGKALTETMKKRLKKLVDEQKIEIRKDAEVIKATSQYTFDNKAPKQQSSLQPALQLSEQQSEIIEIISVHDLNDEDMKRHESPVSSSGSALTKLDLEIGESLSTSETAEWAFLIMSLLLEGVSAVLDQLGRLLGSMLLAFAALLLSTVELIYIARREGQIAFDRRSELPCYFCHLKDKTPTSELFSVIHCFALTCAVWQCLFSTVQYIYALRHLDNPIKMSLLPFIFLVCVLISKSIRKMEKINCQNLNTARTKVKPESDVSQCGDVRLSPGLKRMEQNGQALKIVETKTQVPSNASEPVDIEVLHFGCSEGGETEIEVEVADENESDSEEKDGV